MRVYDLETAIRAANLKAFKTFYKSDINQKFSSNKLSLLELLYSEYGENDSRLKIADFLIEEGVNVNHTTKDKSTALHFLLGSSNSNWRANPDYLLQATDQLIHAGADVNIKDSHGGTPLSYAIAVLKGPTDDLLPIYRKLLEAGAYVDERSGKPSCIELTKMFSWRSELLPILEEYDD